eukprot:620654-Amorphochlora_amoeboformis.AAC.1
MERERLELEARRRDLTASRERKAALEKVQALLKRQVAPPAPPHAPSQHGDVLASAEPLDPRILPGMECDKQSLMDASEPLQSVEAGAKRCPVQTKPTVPLEVVPLMSHDIPAQEGSVQPMNQPTTSPSVPKSELARTIEENRKMREQIRKLLALQEAFKEKAREDLETSKAPDDLPIDKKEPVKFAIDPEVRIKPALSKRRKDQPQASSTDSNSSQVEERVEVEVFETPSKSGVENSKWASRTPLSLAVKNLASQLDRAMERMARKINPSASPGDTQPRQPQTPPSAPDEPKPKEIWRKHEDDRPLECHQEYKIPLRTKGSQPRGEYSRENRGFEAPSGRTPPECLPREYSGPFAYTRWSPRFGTRAGENEARPKRERVKIADSTSTRPEEYGFFICNSEELLRNGQNASQ